jgi:hypothetical protein
MRGFTATFLREGAKLFPGKAKPGIHLGAFGKHPGWDDHMEGLGMETESLLSARRILYVDGIGGQINSGVWEKLSPDDRLDGFNHVFIWKREGAFLLGKIWSSRDGKGRTQYPMIVCAHCKGIPLSAALAGVLPVIEDYESFCKQTTSPEEVQQGLQRAIEALRRIVADAGGFPALDQTRQAAFIEAIATAGGDEVFLRVLYRLQTQLDAGAGDWDARSVRIRLPSLPGFEIDAFLYWNRFLDARTGGRAPILTVAPIAQTWIDALIGKPGAGDFHFLRAGPGAVAISSDVAYGGDDGFRKKNQAVLDAMRTSAGYTDGGASPRKTWINNLLSPG